MAWLPTLLVIVLTAVALTEAGSPPDGRAPRRLWMAVILLLGLLAIASSVTEERRTAALIADVRRPATLPAADGTNHGEAGTSELGRRAQSLQEQLQELEEGRHARLIGTEMSEKLSEYLRSFGPRPVVVSCIPDDIEAYNYANQIVNIFKAASWDARGPEVTKIFGDIVAMGVNVYGGGENNSETVKILLDGFAKFNIPYHIRVAPSGSIPDNATVELFIGAKPPVSAKAESN